MINADIQLKFEIFNAFFNYLKHVEKIIKRSIYSLNAIIIKTCKKVSIKFTKYYFKIKDNNKTIYNLVNILNFTMKLSLYKD